MKLYDKKDNINFPIVNFPFICSNIQNVQAAPVYGVYISLLIRNPALVVPIMISLIWIAANKEASEPRVLKC